MSAETSSPHLKNVATILKDIVDKKLQGLGTYTKDPELGERDIIEYDSHMRSLGMEKFNGPCYGAFVNFYRNKQAMDAHNALGAVTLYLNLESADKVLKGLGYKVKLMDEDSVLTENTGIFCKDLAESFLGSISSLGYAGLVVSPPTSFMNAFSEGIEFDYNEYKYYEMNFFMWKAKAFCAEITLGKP